MTGRRQITIELPTSISEAIGRIEDLNVQLAMIDTQLVDPARASDARWAARAVAAQRVYEKQIGLLEDWINQRPSAPDKPVPKSRLTAQLASQDGLILQCLDLLRRSHETFMLMRDDGVELEPEERTLAEDIGRLLDSQRSEPLALARLHAGAEEIGPEESTLLWSIIATHTRDQGDIASLKNSLERFLRLEKINDSRVFWIRILDALLSGGHADWITAVIGRLERAGQCVVWAEVRGKLFQATGEHAHLDAARAVIESRTGVEAKEQALAWARLYGYSRASEDHGQMLRFYESAFAELDPTDMDGFRLGMINALCETDLIEDATRLEAQIISPDQKILALYKLGLSSEHADFAYRAAEIAKAHGPASLETKSFTALIRLCATYEMSARAAEFAKGTSNSALRSYGYSFLASLAPRGEQQGALLATANQELDRTPATRDQEGPRSRACLALAWSFARCGRPDRAMRYAKTLKYGQQRCKAFVLIDAALKDVSTNSLDYL